MHFEKFTQRDRAASETGFCFDSLTEKSWGKKIFKLRACGVGGLWAHMVIRRSDQVCQSAPSPTRAKRAKRECVCARARVSVCACVIARACVSNAGDPNLP